MTPDQSQTKLTEQIRQAQSRNKYLKNNIQLIKQALDDTHSHSKSNSLSLSASDANTLVQKQIQTAEKNIAIAQRQLNKVRTTALSLDELMSESVRLEKAIKEKAEMKKNLMVEIAKVKKEMYVKQRGLEDPQEVAKLKIEAFELQIKTLKKKLSLLEITSKPSPSVLLTHSPSIPTPQKQPKKQDHSHQTKLLKQQLSLYTNLCQSYKKKLEGLTNQVAALQLRQAQKQTQTEAVDKQIQQWISKIQELKNLAPPTHFRKGVTQKKLVKLI